VSGGGFLDVCGIDVHYGQAILAVQNVTIEVKQGSVVSLFGANGAGKTTTLKAISKLLGQERGEVTRGEITWRGEAIERLSLPILSAGHCSGDGGPAHFSAAHRGRKSHCRRFCASTQPCSDGWEFGADLRVVSAAEERRKSRAGLTSGGEQQMLAIGRALMTKPILVLLDEPSMGLAPIIVQKFSLS